MNKKIKLVAGIVGFILLIALAVLAYNLLSNQVSPDAKMRESGERGQPAIDFRMADWDGSDIRLSDFIAQGKPVVINFWASWCPPCVVEMPDFNRAYLELGNEVQFIMLNLADGMRETVQTGKNFIEQHGFSFPVLFDTRQDAARAYQIQSIPTTVFIDRDGYLSGRPVIGMIDEQALRRRIALIQ